MAFDGFPHLIGWELTLACNLRCRHCGSTAGAPRGRELSTNEALGLIDQFPALLVTEVDLTGGEPLLRSDWPVLVRRLTDRGITCKMVTNGMALSAEVVRRMRESGLAGVGISLDGLRESHDLTRAHPGAFSRVLQAVRLVLGSEIPLTVITTVHARNIDELPALLELMQELGVRNWRLQPLLPSGRSREDDSFRLSGDDFLSLGRLVHHWETEHPPEGVTVWRGDAYGYYEPYDGAQPPWAGCSAGRYALGITSDGKVKGCLSMPDELIEGDLRRDDLWDIWFRPEAFAYNRCFSRADLGSNCTGCERGDDCMGGCAAMSYTSSGVIHNDPYCFLALTRHRLAGAVSSAVA